MYGGYLVLGDHQKAAEVIARHIRNEAGLWGRAASAQIATLRSLTRSGSGTKGEFLHFAQSVEREDQEALEALKKQGLIQMRDRTGQLIWKFAE